MSKRKSKKSPKGIVKKLELMTRPPIPRAGWWRIGSHKCVPLAAVNDSHLAVGRTEPLRFHVPQLGDGDRVFTRPFEWQDVAREHAVVILNTGWVCLVRHKALVAPPSRDAHAPQIGFRDQPVESLRFGTPPHQIIAEGGRAMHDGYVDQDGVRHTADGERVFANARAYSEFCSRNGYHRSGGDNHKLRGQRIDVSRKSKPKRRSNGQKQ